ncbi:DNAse I-like superfamily protein [Perilla frutescens var. hirtella]|uniref:DNAse I-like superfamily protein n=1 Tax=Perilla frutescens var. hirtella TaxID=608512 RepID=A0AAD4NWZ2_PERFH|nr:DNAse I-like superfamily protein [Perilla frutescens var. hirtella]
MLYVLSRRLRRLCSSIRWFVWRRRPRTKLVIRRLGRLNSVGLHRRKVLDHKNGLMISSDHFGPPLPRRRPIRLATFNAALFSLAPAVPTAEKSVVLVEGEGDSVKIPKGILKQSPLHPMINTNTNMPENEAKLTKPRPKVSINLPENEISLAQNRVLTVIDDSCEESFRFNNNSTSALLSAMRSPICFPGGTGMANWWSGSPFCGGRTVFDVLKEVDADILSMQDVKADEANDMKPLSELARALGMNYVFAESWAPEYGNAVLSKWPIKKWRVQKICDDKDFRNVIRATIEVPWTGELSVYSTQLDHLDETWRMKQINAMIQSNNDHQPHILAGGLNSLDASDYSLERWNHIVKYYEELGKPTPKVEVTNFLKGRGYTDAKDFPGECEPVVMIAKGQNVQGTCKYGTRVDYILGSPGLNYAFVPGSYSVISSKGTSDHHIVKVDILKVEDGGRKRSYKKLRQRFVRMSNSCSSRGANWEMSS